MYLCIFSAISVLSALNALSALGALNALSALGAISALVRLAPLEPCCLYLSTYLLINQFSLLCALSAFLSAFSARNPVHSMPLVPLVLLVS